MKIEKPSQLLSLPVGCKISRRNLFDVIQYSKIEGSNFWDGSDFIIGNTPQQGINWIGKAPYLKGVIIKTRNGAYKDDGWENTKKSSYRYSFKSRNESINLAEKANDVLVKQLKYGYPIFLFMDTDNNWEYQGSFYIKGIGDSYVSLEKNKDDSTQVELSQDEVVFLEGSKKYAVHLVVERSKSAVHAVKAASEWICNICGQNYFDKYGVEYIEAHHKVSLANYTGENIISVSDFALLCPNCHKAVHIYMKITSQDYENIRHKLMSLN
jgi:putative restriction endonuclease